MNLKKIILSNKVFYEFYFFVSGKKLNKHMIDKKIKKLNKIKFSDKEIDVVISLTSYGERLVDLKYTLYSLITQKEKAKKIIVWLAFGEKIPEELRVFESYGVNYSFCEDFKSYKKLIPFLKSYNNTCVITVDDDIFYSKNWLSKMWRAHIDNPTCKIAHVAHKILFDQNGVLKSYKEWKFNVNKGKGLNLFPTGCGGILYPNIEYDSLFLDDSLFMKYAPFADDVWFYFMGFVKKQETVIVHKPYNKLKYVDIYKEYGLNNKGTLQSINVSQSGNDEQIKNVQKILAISDMDLL